MQNTQPISFGTLRNNVTGVVGWALAAAPDLLAWGLLVNERGYEVTKSFQAGDELQFPAGAIRVGVS